MRNGRLAVLLILIFAAFPAGAAAPPVLSTVSTPHDQVAALARDAGGRVDVHWAPELGTYDAIRARGRSLLSRDDARLAPERRARAFLSDHGRALGIDSRGLEQLKLLRIDRDDLGMKHVRFTQSYRGLPVFGAQVIVHMNARGITAVNGVFVPKVAVRTKPLVAAAEARKRAEHAFEKDERPRARASSLQVYRTGLLQRRPGDTVLAWAVDVDTAHSLEQVWVDAATGAVLDRIELEHQARDRCAYTPQYDPQNPDRFIAREEGDAPTHVPPVDNLFDFTGHVYDFFQGTFGRDSIDGNGLKMRTVYYMDPACPNAFYRSSTRATYYCPGFDIDDIVAHEWAHGYTNFTHGLIYAWQAGALNESYSDIFGEVIDLTNSADGIGGSNNAEPYPAGQRWLVGEDLTEPVDDALVLRDMWNPERRNTPSKVSSSNYFCATGDNGGVHYNSSVPNHAFAMLVDGKTFNGVTVEGIGLERAVHIYYRAMAYYQTPTSNFATHDQALRAACNDLIDAPLRGLYGAPYDGRVRSSDCEEVARATEAVEMSDVPEQCGFQPLLLKDAPPVCGGASVLFSEDFADDLAGWSTTSTGKTPDWPGYNWQARGALPGGRPGSAAFAVDPTAGACKPADPNVTLAPDPPGPDVSGRFTLDSEPIPIPSDAPDALRLRFDHYVETQPTLDGGNVKVKVNDGAYTLVPANAFRYNGPPGPLAASSNPLAAEIAWSGSDGGTVAGSWGTTVIDLSSIAGPGDVVSLRFDFGLNCSGGRTGWFVDDVVVYACPPLPAPAVRLNGYEDPDTDGSFELAWDRPTSATGPDEVQERVIGTPLFADDAESGLGRWDVTTTGAMLGWRESDQKPNHDSTAFYATPNEAAFAGVEGSSILTAKDPIAIPATGETVLRFRHWAMNEPDDGVFVDVTTDGDVWRTLFSEARSDTLQNTLSAYETESFTARTIDLTPFAGQTVRLRFRFTIGFTNYVQRTPFGWFVDDISVEHVQWQTISSEPSTSLPLTRGTGQYSYRVRTHYDFDGVAVPGDWSDEVSVRVT